MTDYVELANKLALNEAARILRYGPKPEDVIMTTRGLLERTLRSVRRATEECEAIAEGRQVTISRGLTEGLKDLNKELETLRESLGL